jgi:bacillithiol biosynthesis deacetylase BshB1
MTLDPAVLLDFLVIAPHPDDAELGMGGAIVRFKEGGFRVGVLDLTDGEPTPFGDPQTRARETRAATEILGLDWRGNLGLPNRSLQPTLEARGLLAGVIRQLRPRILFCPYWVDAHPDHTAAVELIEAARFWSKLTKTDLSGEPHHPSRIFYYHCVHLRIVEKPAFVLDITSAWPKKLASIECYRSQFITGRPTQSPTFLEQLRDQAAFWGSRIGTAYGEPFDSREPLGVSSMRDLI